MIFVRRRYIPVGAAVIPVGEPYFLGAAVHTAEIENAVVGDKGFKAFLVHAGQHVHTVAAVAGAHAADAGFIHIGFFGHIVGSAQVILHGQAAMVLADLLVPGCTMAGHAAAVGQDNDIALAGH